MKIIEAMKEIKANREKVNDLQGRIANVSANLSHETPVYGDETAKKIREWAQSCSDLAQENVRLHTAIARTNLTIQVTIELGGKQVTKTIAEWVWRRREYAAIDQATWSKMTDRGLKEGLMPSSTGAHIEVKIVRHYDPNLRDEKISIYREEPHKIDSALEVINAVTDIIEA